MRRSVRPLVPLNRELTRITGSRTTMPPPGITRDGRPLTRHGTAMRRGLRPGVLTSVLAGVLTSLRPGVLTSVRPGLLAVN
ncbi:hypothetical protein, partial [Streptomyces hygroscopicus]|uniref:hypothetical protein n=1 Tax=Streptomyces hygroscopicus TaxID=1912 RepID=UPI00131CDC48